MLDILNWPYGCLGRWKVPLPTLAFAITIFFKPSSNYRSTFWWSLCQRQLSIHLVGGRDIDHATINIFNVSCHFSVSITELIRLDLDAASISLRHWYRSLKVCLLVNGGHHALWVDEIIRSLQLGSATVLWGLFHRRMTGCAMLAIIIINFIHMHAEFSSPVVLSDFSL